MKKSDYSKLSKDELVKRLQQLENNELDEKQEAIKIFNATYFHSTTTAILIDKNGIVLDANKKAAPSGKKNLVGKSVITFVSEKYQPLIKRKINEVYKTGKTAYYELEGRVDNNTERTAKYKSDLNPIIVNGKVVAAVIITRDISQELILRENLSIVEDKYSKLFEFNPQPMFLYDNKTLKFIDVNKATVDFYGYTKKQLLGGMTLLDIRPKEEHAKLIRHLKLVNQNKISKNGKVDCYFNHIKSNGEIITVEIYRNQIELDNKEYNLALVVDVTENLKSKKERSLSEEKFKRLSELSNQGIVIHQKGIIVEVNAAYYDMFGYTRDEVIGTSILKYTKKEFHQSILNRIKDGNEESYIAIGIRKDKQEIICELQGKPTIYNGEKARVTVITDISKLKKYEEQLELSQQRFKNLSDVAIEGIILSESGKIIDINNSALKMFGYKSEDLIGKQLSILIALQKDRVDLEKNLKRKQTPQSEILGLKKDGTTIVVDSKSSYIRYQSKEIRVSVVSDITQRKLAENKLVENQRFLSSLINNLEGVFYRCDWNKQIPITYVTDGVYKITGYKPKEFIEQKITFDKLVVKEDRIQFLEKVKRAVDKKTRFEITYRIIDKDGNTRWLLERGAGVYNENGMAIAIEGYSVDITPIKNYESQIEIGQKAYKNLVDNSPDCIIIHNQGTIKYVNAAGIKLFGFKSAKSLIGKQTFDFLDKKYWPVVKERMQKIMAGENVSFYEYDIVLSNKKIKSVEIKGVMTEYNNEQSIMLVIHDLTIKKEIEQEKIRARVAEESNKILQEEINQRKKAQKQLQSAQLYTQSIIQSSIDMISASDIHGIITEFNDAAEKGFGYKREEVVGKSMSLIFSNDTQNEAIIQALNTKGFYIGEVLNRRKSGEEFYSYLSASVLKDQAGNIIGHMGVSRDISEIKKSEQKLIESEQRYKTLFNQAHLGIALLDKSGKILQVNNRLCDLLNCEEGNIVNDKKIFNTIHSSEVDFLNKLKQNFKNSFTEDVSYNRRLNNHGQQDVFANISISLIKKQNNEPDFYVAIYDDVTERKIAQEKLQLQSAKLNAIFEGSTHLIWTINAKGVLTSFNSNFANYIHNLFGVIIDPYKTNLENVITKHNKEQLDLWNTKYRTSFKGEQQQFEFKIINKNGDEKWIEIFLHPVYGTKNRITEISGIGVDITERKLATEENLVQSAKINAIFQTSSLMIYTINKEYKLTSFNKNYFDLMLEAYGYETYVGFDYKKGKVKSSNQAEYDRLYNKHLEALSGRSASFESTVKLVNGEIRYYENYLDPIVLADGSVEEITYITLNITDKKNAREQLLQSLNEKEVLLKEVHHRVKNNLQVISSILNLQSSFVKDEAILNILQESQNRIKSMSFIHETLYQTKNFSSLDFSDYITNIGNNLVRSYQLYENKIQIKYTLQHVNLDLDTAIPCGLIINELVSNALKYAYPGETKGVIEVGLKQVDGVVTINVTDKGIGLPKNMDIENNESLGLQLVLALVEQINAKMEVQNEVGSNFIIKFKKQ